MTSPIHQIDQLRKHRGQRPRDLSICGVIATTAEHAERTHKKLGELIALWEELVPAEIAAHTSIVGLRGGVMHVIVDSSSAAFELDRLLRGGLTEELRRRFRGTLTRVRTRSGQLDQGDQANCDTERASMAARPGSARGKRSSQRRFTHNQS